MRAPRECPICGTALNPSAKACPECGADERTGWNEDATRYDGLDLPDEAFAEGDGSENTANRKDGGRLGTRVFTCTVAVIVLLALGALLVF
jgi:hypothetical protein